MTSNTARTVTKRDLNDLLNKKGARHLTLRNNKHGFYFNNALDPLCGSIHVGRSLQSVDMNALSVKIEAATPSPGRLAEMKKMEERRIVHTFVRDEQPLVVEDLPALVCPVCGYTVLDLHVLDALFALDPLTEKPIRHVPVFRLSLAPA